MINGLCPGSTHILQHPPQRSIPEPIQSLPISTINTYQNQSDLCYPREWNIAESGACCADNVDANEYTKDTGEFGTPVEFSVQTDTGNEGNND